MESVLVVVKSFLVSFKFVFYLLRIKELNICIYIYIVGAFSSPNEYLDPSTNEGDVHTHYMEGGVREVLLLAYVRKIAPYLPLAARSDLFASYSIFIF
jgi:hypothetical protein